MNKFSDMNPYEPPIVAELNERHYQPPRAKRWTPYGSIAFTLFGPAAFIVIIRRLVLDLELFGQDSPEFWWTYGTTAAVWLIAAIRSLIWLVAFSWR